MPPKKKLKPRLHGEGEIRERSDGRLEYRMYAPDPVTGQSKRISVYAKTEKELLEKIRKTQVKHAKGELITSGKLTLREWLESHAAAQSTGKREGTIKRYWEYIGYAKSIGHIQLGQLGTRQLDELYQALARGGYSRSVILHTRSFITSALNRAVKYQILSSNPNLLTEVPNVKTEKVAQILTQDQITQLLTEAEASTRYYPVIYTIIALGLRFGEALGLQWRDLDLEAGTVSLSRAVTYMGGPKLTGLKTTTSQRTLYLHPDLITLLVEHQIVQKAELGKLWSPEMWVFASRDGGMLSQNNIRREFKKIITRLGMPNFRIHDLRHSYVTWLISQGVDPKTVSTLVGHADTRLTLDIYTKAQEHLKKQAALQTPSLIKSGGPKMEKGSNRGQKKKTGS
jgi:integrase